METKAKKSTNTTKNPSPKSKSSKKNYKISQSEDPFGGPVFVLAGEHSGDLLGGELLKEIHKKAPQTQFFGIGGKEMESQGNWSSLEDIENLSVIGFWEALRKYKYLKSLMQRLVQEILSKNCFYAILIDYPGFNLRLAKILHEHGIRVIFYVSPQIWAWKFKRIFHIQKYVDLMITLFRFEEDIYKEYGVNAVYAGHPLQKRLQESIQKEKPLSLTINNEIPIGLLPGSRSQEVKKLLPILLNAAKIMDQHFQKNNQKLIFLVPNINPHLEKYIQKKIQKFQNKNPNLQIYYSFQSSSRVMQISKILLLSSGTATLEGVYWEKPMVILYKVSFITYLIASFFVKTRFIGLVNILAGKEVCRELIQAECKPHLVAQEAIALLENKKYYNHVFNQLKAIKERELSVPNPARLAASKILEFIKKTTVNFPQ